MCDFIDILPISFLTRRSGKGCLIFIFGCAKI
nr:MAG TPA: hypothetical protein [Caudoviricetes sp.]